MAKSKYLTKSYNGLDQGMTRVSIYYTVYEPGTEVNYIPVVIPRRSFNKSFARSFGNK